MQDEVISHEPAGLAFGRDLAACVRGLTHAAAATLSIWADPCLSLMQRFDEQVIVLNATRELRRRHGVPAAYWCATYAQIDSVAVWRPHDASYLCPWDHVELYDACAFDPLGKHGPEELGVRIRSGRAMSCGLCGYMKRALGADWFPKKPLDAANGHYDGGRFDMHAFGFRLAADLAEQLVGTPALADGEGDVATDMARRMLSELWAYRIDFGTHSTWMHVLHGLFGGLGRLPMGAANPLGASRPPARWPVGTATAVGVERAATRVGRLCEDSWRAGDQGVVDCAHSTGHFFFHACARAPPAHEHPACAAAAHAHEPAARRTPHQPWMPERVCHAPAPYCADSDLDHAQSACMWPSLTTPLASSAERLWWSVHCLVGALHSAATSVSNSQLSHLSADPSSTRGVRAWICRRRPLQQQSDRQLGRCFAVLGLDDLDRRHRLIREQRCTRIPPRLTPHVTSGERREPYPLPADWELAHSAEATVAVDVACESHLYFSRALCPAAWMASASCSRNATGGVRCETAWAAATCASEQLLQSLSACSRDGAQLTSALSRPLRDDGNLADTPMQPTQATSPPDAQPAHEGPSPRLGCGCVSRDACLPANTTLIFVGDPLLRYQYIDLVYTLRFRSLEHHSRAGCHPLLRTRCSDFHAHADATWRDLQPNERACDCYQPRGVWENTTENRHFVLPECNIRVAYLQALGTAPLNGHWPSPQTHQSLWGWRVSPTLRASKWEAADSHLLRIDEASVLEKFVRVMRPTALVLNAGAWPSSDRLDFHRLREAATSTGAGCVAFQTTFSTPTRAATSADDARARTAFASDIIIEAGAATAEYANNSSAWEWNHLKPQTSIYHLLITRMITAMRVRQCLLPANRRNRGTHHMKPELVVGSSMSTSTSTSSMSTGTSSPAVCELCGTQIRSEAPRVEATLVPTDPRVLWPVGQLGWSLGAVGCFACGRSFLANESSLEDAQAVRGVLKQALRWCVHPASWRDGDCITPTTEFFRRDVSVAVRAALAALADSEPEHASPPVRAPPSASSRKDWAQIQDGHAARDDTNTAVVHVVGNSLARNLAATLLDLLALSSRNRQTNMCAPERYADAPDLRTTRGPAGSYPSHCPQVAAESRRVGAPAVDVSSTLHAWASWTREVVVLLDRGRRARVAVRFHWVPGSHCGYQPEEFDLNEACRLARSTPAHMAVDLLAIWQRTRAAGAQVEPGLTFRYFNHTLVSRCPSVNTIANGVDSEAAGLQTVIVPVGSPLHCDIAAVMKGFRPTHSRLLFVPTDPLDGVQLRQQLSQFLGLNRALSDGWRYFLPLGVEIDQLTLLHSQQRSTYANGAIQREEEVFLQRMRAASVYYDAFHPGAPYLRMAASQVLLAALAHDPTSSMHRLHAQLRNSAPR